MAPRRSTSGLVLAASLFGLTAFVQPTVLGRPVAAERLSVVAMQASAQEDGAEGASWSMPLVAGAAALGLVLSFSGPALAVRGQEKIMDVPGTRQWAVTRDVTYEVPGEGDLFSKISARNLDVSVKSQQNADVTAAVSALEGPKQTKTSISPAPAPEAKK
jgi:hypothetical protein